MRACNEFNCVAVMKAVAPLAIAGAAFAIGVTSPVALGALLLILYSGLYGAQIGRAVSPAAQTA